MIIDRDIGLLVTGAAALLFASASVHKWRDQAEFAAVVARYRILPGPIAALSGWLIPALELALAAALVSGVGRRAAAIAGGALLLAYALAIAINLRRRRTDLDCGCAVRHERRPIARWMVVRNLLLAALLLASALPWNARALGAVDALTVAGGIAILSLLYATIDHLLGQVAPRGALLRGVA